MTINKNFKSRPERLKYSKCMNFSLSGLDLKLLFMVTGAYYKTYIIKSGLYLCGLEFCEFCASKITHLSIKIVESTHDHSFSLF